MSRAVRPEGPRVDRPVGSLSGGERFRVALAGLLHAAATLVLDEPANVTDAEAAPTPRGSRRV